MATKDLKSPESINKTKILKIVLSFVSAVLAIVCAELIASKSGKLFNIGEGLVSSTTYIMFIIRSVIATAAFILLGGKQWLLFKKEPLKNSFKHTSPVVIINLILSILLFMLFLSVQYIPKEQLDGVTIEIVPGYGGRIAALIPLMILVGINEELIFRGLTVGGMLLWFGKKKKGILIAAIISSIIFGYIHVMADIDFSNTSSLMTGLMKTLETSMFGLIFCCGILKYENLWGVIIAHAVFDGLLLAPMQLANGGFNVSYVSADPKQAKIQCIFFGILILLYLPLTIKSIKALSAMQPTEGPFADNE